MAREMDKFHRELIINPNLNYIDRLVEGDYVVFTYLEHGRSIEVKTKKKEIEAINFDQYTSSKLGLPTLKDAKEELLNAGADLRKKKKAFTFDDTVKSIDDLRKDMILPGLVSNITNFGAFVNIGIKQDGLVHVSNIANEFVKDPNEYVHLGMELSVKVLDVDKERNRIQLSMKD